MSTTTPRRRRGAQPGNRNALKHGRTTYAERRITLIGRLVFAAYPDANKDPKALPEPIQLALIKLKLMRAEEQQAAAQRPDSLATIFEELGLLNYQPGDLQRFLAEIKTKTNNEKRIPHPSPPRTRKGKRSQALDRLVHDTRRQTS